jgi:hypothetical protein
MASEAQLDIPKPTIKRIVKEKLAAATGSSEGAKADVQLNKEALLAFGESAKVIICIPVSKSVAAGVRLHFTTALPAFCSPLRNTGTEAPLHAMLSDSACWCSTAPLHI